MNNNLAQMVILAGGLGTRLRPITETIPKSLLPINGEPFITHQLRLLSKHNIRKILLCIGYLGEMIKEVIGNGQQFDLEITYSFDGDKQLGTAGSIIKALPLLAENFLVMYGDSYLLCDFSAVLTTFKQQRKLALMTVYHNQGQWDNSNVEFKNNTILAYDKNNKTTRMQHIDYGLGIFNKAAFADKYQDADLALVYQQLLKYQQLLGYEVTERFYEVGSHAGIQEFSQHISGVKHDLHTPIFS